MVRTLIGLVMVCAYVAGVTVGDIALYSNRIHAAQATAGANVTALKCTAAFTNCHTVLMSADIHWGRSVLLPIMLVAAAGLIFPLICFGVRDHWKEQEELAQAG